MGTKDDDKATADKVAKDPQVIDALKKVAPDQPVIVVYNNLEKDKDKKPPRRGLHAFDNT